MAPIIGEKSQLESRQGVGKPSYEILQIYPDCG